MIVEWGLDFGVYEVYAPPPIGLFCGFSFCIVVLNLFDLDFTIKYRDYLG